METSLAPVLYLISAFPVTLHLPFHPHKPAARDNESLFSEGSSSKAGWGPHNEGLMGDGTTGESREGRDKAMNSTLVDGV